MSAVEELQAAIDKLTKQRGDSADWWAFEGDSTAIYQTTEDGREDHVLDTVEESDRDLIVTLHRTIDAQLDWLRDQVARMRAEVSTIGSPEVHYRHALALARAINGGVQS